MKELSKKHGVSRLAVDEDSAGQRIDNFLVRVLKGVPKSHIYRIVRSGEVRINSGRVSPATRLAVGDIVRIPPLRFGQKSQTDERTALKRGFKPTILVEDDWLIAVDKPAGIAVHGGSGVALGVIEQLRATRPEARFLELVHRLDRGTSGVLLVAKKRAALIALHEQFRSGDVDKRYLVLARGPWTDGNRIVDLPLQKLSGSDGERRVRVHAGGRESTTVLRLERSWPAHLPPLALLEAQLMTGRTHQIRVHLAHIHHPLAGDDKYGDFAWNRELAREGLKRMFLHARQVTFMHPARGDALTVTSALPEELRAFLRQVSLCS